MRSLVFSHAFFQISANHEYEVLYYILTIRDIYQHMLTTILRFAAFEFR
jgi:hypothetical protein